MIAGDHTGGTGATDAGKTEGHVQRRFEDAVFAVMLTTVETGRRIDLAVSDYLDRFPIDTAEQALRPDLIICVADCIGLIRRTAIGDENARNAVIAAHRSWVASPPPGYSPLDRDTTMVQRCIGAIRRAIQTAAP